MPKLRSIVIDRIFQSLERSTFNRSDFEITFDRGDCLVRIGFVADSRFWFAIRELTPIAAAELFFGRFPKAQLATQASPGDYKRTDARSHESIESCLSHLRDWCSNLHEDLSVAEVAPEDPDDFLVRLDEALSRSAIDLKARFSPVEIEKLRNQMEDLAARFEELLKKSEITEDQLSKIRKEIDQMQETLPRYTKHVWYRTSGTRWLRMMRDLAKSPEGRAFILEAAKKLLLPG